MSDLVDFVAKQKAWGLEAFGPNYTGTLPHLKKEIKEVEADQDDLEEWIDVILLGLSGACRSGGGRTPEEVVEALWAKYAKNQSRTWPDWRQVPDGVAIEHDRSDEPRVCANCGQPVVLSTFAGLGYMEPDYDPATDGVVWRHQKTGYAACGNIRTWAEPAGEQA